MDKNQNKGHDSFKITGDWKIQSQKLKDKFSQLTDYDLKFDKGKETNLLDRMGNKLRKNREEVMEIIKTLHLS
jgi:phage anti-repressor protein